MRRCCCPVAPYIQITDYTANVDLAAITSLPFIQVALPIMLTFAAATWYQNKRIDDLRGDMRNEMNNLRADMNRQFGEILRRLDRIEAKLENHNERITRLEERTSPLTGSHR